MALRLLEPPKNDLPLLRKTAPDPRASLSTSQKILTNPVVSKTIDILAEGLKTVGEAGKRYPRGIMKTLEGLQTGKPSHPLTNIFTPTPDPRNAVQIAQEMGQRVMPVPTIQDPQSKMQYAKAFGQAALQDLPFTIAGVTTELFTNPINALLGGLASKASALPIMQKSIKAPKIIDEGIMKIIETFNPALAKDLKMGKTIESIKQIISSKRASEFEGWKTESGKLLAKYSEPGALEAEIKSIVPEADVSKIRSEILNNWAKTVYKANVTKVPSMRLRSPKELLTGEKGQIINPADIPQKMPGEAGKVPIVIPPVPAPPVSPLIEEARKKEISEEPIYVPKNLIKTSIAMRAHQGTSFSPEKRGQQEVESFKSELQYIYDSLKFLAKTPEQKQILVDEMQRFEGSYAAKTNDLLSSHGGLFSSMITGPSNFPVKRMEKKNAAYQNKVESVNEWKERAINSIKRTLKEQKIAEAGGEVEYQKKKITDAEEFQDIMKKVNTVIRKNIPESEKISRMMEVDKRITEEVAKKLLTPDFAGRIGFPDYELTNNNARMRQMRQRLSEMEKKEATPSSELTFEGGKIFDNADIDRVQVIHDVKPASEVIQSLKSKGFKWSPENKAWQRKRTLQALYDAKKMFGLQAQPSYVATTQPVTEPVADVPIQPPAPSEIQPIEDRAEMEIEMMHYSNGLHPLEKAMRDIGKIRVQAKGKEAEESQEIPSRFLSQTGRPIDERRQELENKYGITFESDSDLRQALKELGGKQQRFLLSSDVQAYLKSKPNIEALGRKLGKKISPAAYKRIIYSNVGLKPSKTPFTSTKENMFKYVLKQREIAARGGEKAGIKLGVAREENIYEGIIDETKRQAELDVLKADIMARDKSDAERGRLIQKYEQKLSELKRSTELKKLKEDILTRDKLISKIADLKSRHAEKKEIAEREHELEILKTDIISRERGFKKGMIAGRKELRETIRGKKAERARMLEAAQRFPREQRYEIYKAARKAGLILPEKKDPEGKVVQNYKNRLTPLLRFYKKASFDEIMNYIRALRGDPENPPLVFKISGDPTADAETMKLIAEASEGWEDINRLEIGSLDLPRIVEKVTGLEIWEDNILADNTYEVLKGADDARFERMSDELQALEDNAKEFAAETKASAELMRKFEVGENLSEKEQKAADFLRSKYDDLIKQANENRERLGKKPIPYRKDYMTHIRDWNLLTTFFKGDQKAIDNLTNEQWQALAKGQYSKISVPFNQFAQQRTGKKTKFDAIGNYKKYLETLLYEIYMSPAIKHARVFTDYALLKQPNAKIAIDNLLDELAGKPSSFDHIAIRPIVSNPVLKALNARFGANALIGNISYYIMNASNIATASGELGNYTIKGMHGFLSNSYLRQLAFKKSSLLKSRQGLFDFEISRLEAVFAGHGKDLTFWEGAKLKDKQLEYVISSINRIIEYNNVGSSWVGAYLKAIDKFKYSPEKAYKYADSVARKTQGGYRPYEMPAYMRSDIGKLASKFGTWAFNMMNYFLYDLKMANIPGNIAGIITKAPKKEVQFGKLIVLAITLMFVNTVYKKMGLRKPYNPKSFVPATPLTRGRYEQPPAGRIVEDIKTLLPLEGERKEKPSTRAKAAEELFFMLGPRYGGAQLRRLFHGDILPEQKKERKNLRLLSNN